MKKLGSILIAAFMTAAVSVPAYAAGEAAGSPAELPVIYWVSLPIAAALIGLCIFLIYKPRKPKKKV